MSNYYPKKEYKWNNDNLKASTQGNTLVATIVILLMVLLGLIYYVFCI